MLIWVLSNRKRLRDKSEAMRRPPEEQRQQQQKPEVVDEESDIDKTVKHTDTPDSIMSIRSTQSEDLEKKLSPKTLMKWKSNEENDDKDSSKSDDLDIRKEESENYTTYFPSAQGSDSSTPVAVPFEDTPGETPPPPANGAPPATSPTPPSQPVSPNPPSPPNSHPIEEEEYTLEQI